MTARALVSILLLLASSVPAAVAADKAPASVREQLQSAIAGSQRSEAHKKRDAARHPLQTLEFFGLRPDMQVIEVLPEGGWYTEILAPFLDQHGQLIEASFPPTSRNPFLRKMAQRFRQKLADDPAVYGNVRVEPFAMPDYMALGAPHSVDRILTFRNLHDFVFANVHDEVVDVVVERFLRSAYQVLKPGGVLGIVSHRAKAEMPVSESYKLGRLPQNWVIGEAEQAGFELVASSAINANPKDPRTKPVWYLPPTLKQGQKNRAKYQAIGEADNMTLKFVKPAGDGA